MRSGIKLLDLVKTTIHIGRMGDEVRVKDGYSVSETGSRQNAIARIAARPTWVELLNPR